jgi:L-serine dehydratase
MVSLLDIIGPVMVGPSSSHTAGACRIALLGRGLVGGTPESAVLELHGSFARTGEGHGTDKALAGGLLGFRPDDERLRTALEIASGEGLDYRFEKTTVEGDAVHPNTVRMTLTRGADRVVVVGESLGAGRVRLGSIDGYPVDISGSYYTKVVLAEDRRGSIARIAQVLADGEINIATLKVSRRERGGDAFMVVEADDPITVAVCDEVRALPWVRWVRALDKVSA